MANWCLTHVTLTAPSVDEADEFWTAFTAGEDYKDVQNVIADEPGSPGGNGAVVWEGDNRPVWGLMDRTGDLDVYMDYGSRNVAPIDFFSAMEGLGWQVQALWFEPSSQFCGNWCNGQKEEVEFATAADIPACIQREFEVGLWMVYDEAEDENEQSSD